MGTLKIQLPRFTLHPLPEDSLEEVRSHGNTSLRSWSMQKRALSLFPLRARQTRRRAVRRCREPPAQERTANCRTCEPMETAPFPGDDTRAGGTPVRGHESTDHGCGQTCRGMEGLVRRQVLAQRTRADVNVRPRPL